MAITSARMQMRRGQEVNFDPDKMLPGEWSVSLDTKYVRMCFSPGVCVRMATYEAFENDMAQIQSILAEARTIQEAVTRINTEVSANAKAVAEYTSQAKQYRDEAESFKNQASAIVGVDIATESVPGLMAGGDNAVENGILTLTKVTTDRTLIKSHAGGLKVNSIDGESQQDGTPSPDVPIEIDSVVVSEIKSVGKNLLKNVSETTTKNGVTFTVNEDKSITVNGKATADTYWDYQLSFKPKVGETYIRSGANYLLSGGLMAYYYGFNGTDDWRTNNTSFTPTTSDTIYFGIYVKNGTTVNGNTFYPMIRPSEIEDATYEPYRGESIVQLSNPITLRGIGDVKDTIVKQDGVFGVLSKMYEFTLNGTQTPNAYSGGSFGFNAFDNIIAKVTASSVTGNGLSERFLIANSDKVYAGSVDNSFAIANTEYVRLRLYSSRFTSVNDVTAFFTENPTKFIVPLATPTFEPLPLADQIALHQLETFDTVTYIYTDSTIEPIMEMEYGTSVVGAYALKGMNTAEANKLQNEAYRVEIEQLKATTLSLSNALLESEV